MQFKNQIKINTEVKIAIAETMLTLQRSYGKKHLVNFLKELKLDDQRIINKCQEVAIRTSYYIYCRRRKEWTDPELMSYR